MPEVEVDHMAVRRPDRAALLNLLHECLRQTIPRPELHRAKRRPGLRLAEVVILQVAVPIFVDQVSAFSSRGLSDQDSSKGQAGWMVMDEFHVFERRARAIR